VFTADCAALTASYSTDQFKSKSILVRVYKTRDVISKTAKRRESRGKMRETCNNLRPSERKKGLPESNTKLTSGLNNNDKQYLTVT